MIQLSRLPRCYARAEGDTSTGPKSSYRKVGTVRTLRTITGGPLRRLEDLAAGLRRRLSGAPLATKHANLAGCLLVQSTEGRPPNRNAAFSRAGSGYGGAASAGAFGFPGDRRFSVGAEPSRLAMDALASRDCFPDARRRSSECQGRPPRRCHDQDRPHRSQNPASIKLRRRPDLERPWAISEVCGLSTLVSHMRERDANNGWESGETQPSGPP